MSTPVKGLTASPPGAIHRTPLGIHPDGELGPLCAACGVLLRWGASMTVDEDYLCWEHYLERTGAEPATEGLEVHNPYAQSGMVRAYAIKDE